MYICVLTLSSIRGRAVASWLKNYCSTMFIDEFRQKFRGSLNQKEVVTITHYAHCLLKFPALKSIEEECDSEIILPLYM